MFYYKQQYFNIFQNFILILRKVKIMFVNNNYLKLYNMYNIES